MNDNADTKIAWLTSSKIWCSRLKTHQDWRQSKHEDNRHQSEPWKPQFTKQTWNWQHQKRFRCAEKSQDLVWQKFEEQNIKISKTRQCNKKKMQGNKKLIVHGKFRTKQ